MNKILLIGNSGLKNGQMDGQTIKVRLYLKKIKDEGFSVCFVDLENFLRHPLSILHRIKKGIKECDRIVLLTAERGSKLLVPYINKINKNHKKPFVFPLVGTSVLHYTIDSLPTDKKNAFILKKDFLNLHPDKKLVKELKQISYILPETDGLSDVFKAFYDLNNVVTLTNFREIETKNTRVNSDNILNLIYVSRVMEEKGIFDLIECVNNINKDEKYVKLDIYGGLSFNKIQKEKFINMINCDWISYRGAIPSNQVVQVLAIHDLFVFPTRFVHEGTPGVIVESLLAGTPILTSNFPQVGQLLKTNVDSIAYEMFNTEELMQKLLYIINNREILKQLKIGAIESGKKFTYQYNRNRFLKYICGIEEE